MINVDPLEHKLFFERFLNRERADAPDFDLDFCWRRRDRVLEYVYERFGAERVAMIATFCRLGARGALREVARALGIPYREISRVTRRVPHFSSVEMLAELRETLPECRGLPLERPPWDEVLLLALAIDMVPRHIAVHPGGILTPLQRHLTHEEMVRSGWIDEDGNPRHSFKTPEQGAATTLWCATSPQLAVRAPGSPLAGPVTASASRSGSPWCSSRFRGSRPSSVSIFPEVSSSPATRTPSPARA